MYSNLIQYDTWYLILELSYIITKKSSTGGPLRHFTPSFHNCFTSSSSNPWTFQSSQQRIINLDSSKPSNYSLPMNDAMKTSGGTREHLEWYGDMWKPLSERVLLNCSCAHKETKTIFSKFPKTHYPTKHRMIPKCLVKSEHKSPNSMTLSVAILSFGGKSQCIS